VEGWIKSGHGGFEMAEAITLDGIDAAGLAAILSLREDLNKPLD
jgi:hypothetical protein